MEDEDRGRILDRSRLRYSGPTCADQDDNLHECVEMCRDIYNRRSDRADCEELPIIQIEVLAELYEILLEDPDDDELDRIDLKDFEVYLKVSISSFDRLIGKYSKSEAKELLFMDCIR